MTAPVVEGGSEGIPCLFIERCGGLARCMFPPLLHSSPRSLILSPIRDGCFARLVHRKAPTTEAPSEQPPRLCYALSLSCGSPLHPSLPRVSREDETGGGGGRDEDGNHVHESLYMYWTRSDNFIQIRVKQLRERRHSHLHGIMA